ncbi:MAG TPA: uroporphyrinogen-III synthase, partial [Flavisolibacter sp.]|nr:uroporphyrinogen-III synthase [Flavisolibacter sp.]
QQDSEITGWLKANNCDFSLAFMYRTVSSDVKDILVKNDYDVICFFTQSGVKSLFDNLPKYEQNGTVIGAFGNNTSKAVEDAGLQLTIKAPQPQTPSMVAALDQFLATTVKKK